MTEEQKPSVPHAPFSSEAISEFLSKNGISTFLLLLFLYVSYQNFLKPASDRYMKLLDSVSASNVSLTATIDDLRIGLRDVGERNTELSLSNSASLSSIDSKLESIEELSKDIDRKLDMMRQPRGYAPTSSPQASPQ